MCLLVLLHRLEHSPLPCHALAFPCSSTSHLAPLPGSCTTHWPAPGSANQTPLVCWEAAEELPLRPPETSSTAPFSGTPWRVSSWALTYTHRVSCNSSLESQEVVFIHSWGMGGWEYLLAGVWCSPQPRTSPSSATASMTVQIYVHRGCLSLCLNSSEEKKQNFLPSPAHSSPLRPCSRSESYTSTGRSSRGSSRSSHSRSSHHKASPRYSGSRSCSSGKR